MARTELPNVNLYARPATNVQLVMTRHEAAKQSREFGLSAIITAFLVTLFVALAGILHIHYEHGYAGAIFTAGLIGGLMLVNVLGYVIVAFFAGVMEARQAKDLGTGEREKLLCDDEHEA